MRSCTIAAGMPAVTVGYLPSKDSSRRPRASLGGVFLDVASKVNLQPSIAGEFLPMFKIYKDQAVVRQGKNTYPMLNDQVLGYDPGQKDVCRFSARVASGKREH